MSFFYTTFVPIKTHRNMEYKSRIADRLLTEILDAMGAVLIQGPKACGKSWTAARQAGSIVRIDDPSMNYQYRLLAQTDIPQLLDGATPRVIDEWQEIPEIWDAVRHEVDRRHETGQFILTGSAVPAQSDNIHHTGTGRFGWLTMRPMSLWESEDSSGDISLAALFDSPKLIKGKGLINISQLAYLICRGGWPQTLAAKSEKGALQYSREYFNAIINNDISRVDKILRNPERAARLMRVYARHQGAQVPLTTLKDDLKANESSSLSENSISQYLDALRAIFVIEDVKAWNPNLRSKTAVRSSDTRYYIDPSIATAALGIGPEDLVTDLNTMGLLLETLCIRDLRVYAEAIDGSVYHYRDKNGLECDAVIHLRNGRYGLVEIKLGGEKLIEEGAATLNTLTSIIDTTKMKSPSFRMVLTGVGEFAYTRPDGVHVVPVSSLRN